MEARASATPVSIAGRLEAIAELKGHLDTIWCCAWSPSGKALATSSGDRKVRIWVQEGSSWVCKDVLDDGVHSRAVRCVAWSPCGRFLATCSFDGKTAVWENHHGEFECVASLEGHDNEVKGVAWSPSGALLATCSRDKSVWIWSAAAEGGEDAMAGPADREYECISVGNSHTQDVKGVRWHPRDEILFSYSYDNTIRIWREEEDDWYCVETLPGHESTVWQLAFDPSSPSGSRFVTCSDDRTLRFWERNSLSAPAASASPTPLPATAVAPVRKSWRTSAIVRGVHSRTIFAVDWSKEGRVATGAADNAVLVFARRERPPGGAEEEKKATIVAATAPPADEYELVASQPDAHDGDVNTVAWHPSDPSLLATGGDDGIVRLWRFRTIDTDGADGAAETEKERRRIAQLHAVEAAAQAKLSGTAADVAAAAQERAVPMDEKEEEEEEGEHGHSHGHGGGSCGCSSGGGKEKEHEHRPDGGCCKGH